jgi:gliding motility-associated-like protein
MDIFNRWGQLIFQTSDMDQGWNGKHEGKSEEVGTYVYVINLVYITGEKATAKGSFVLLR